jgi:hypothetical protein
MGTKQQRFGFLRRKSGEIAADVDDELRTHLELRIEALMAAGLSRDDARREAIRRFGDIDGTRQYCRRQHEEKERTMQRRLAVTDFMQDMRIGCAAGARAGARADDRRLGRPGHCAATAMFAILDAALLRPLPYAQPEQLMRIFTDAPPYKFRFSVADYLALAAQQTSFTRVAAYADRPMTYTDGASAERLRGRQVSWTYFDTLGIVPVLGRAFTAADGRPGAPPAVILSHHFWQQRLGGSAEAIGKAVRLDSVDYSVVGVLPAVTGPLETGQDYFVAASGTRRAARDRSSSRPSAGCRMRAKRTRPERNCARSTHASFRSGRLPIRTRRRPGA